MDTHIIVWWFGAPKKLSREQTRAIEDALRRHEPIGISAMTLLEIAVQYGRGGRLKSESRLDELLSELSSSPSFRTLPLDFDVAAEVAAVGRLLPDPADRAIVATARVHRLKLITSDERIIDSGLVPIVA